MPKPARPPSRVARGASPRRPDGPAAGSPAVQGIIHAPTSPLVDLLAKLPRVARSQATVLVTGESGVGKEGVVRALHALSHRAQGPFVPTNCGAIPENLLESELFGHVRGAFTGADRPRIGRLEAANDGTLFLDEIGEMPLALQVKLLRVLQEHEFEPLGSHQPRKATFRLVAATNRDLLALVEEGTFRLDLFYRLDVVRLVVPPLRERPQDVGPLARHFLQVYGPPNESTVRDLTPEALALLEGYAWPGNVRELENLVQGVLVLKTEGLVDASDVAHRVGAGGRLDDLMRRTLTARRPSASSPRTRSAPEPATNPAAEAAVARAALRGAGRGGAWGQAQAPPDLQPGEIPHTLPEDGLDLRRTLELYERRMIRQALRRSAGNRTAAAGLLGLNRTTLVEKLKRMDAAL